MSSKIDEKSCLFGFQWKQPANILTQSVDSCFENEDFRKQLRQSQRVPG